jgi:hypothetical protein
MLAALLPIVVFVAVVTFGVVYDIDCTREGRPWW